MFRCFAFIIHGEFKSEPKLMVFYRFRYYLQRSKEEMTPPHPYHTYSASYLPISAIDSERQSLSSEALTDDTHSITDSSLWVYSSTKVGRDVVLLIQQCHNPPPAWINFSITVHSPLSRVSVLFYAEMRAGLWNVVCEHLKALYLKHCESWIGLNDSSSHC